MSKFKVGDKALITKDLYELKETHPEYGIDDEMLNYVYYMDTVEEVYDKGVYLKNNNFFWHDDLLLSTNDLIKDMYDAIARNNNKLSTDINTTWVKETNEEHELLEYALELLNISREELENKKKQEDNKYKLKPLLDKISNACLCDYMYCNDCEYVSKSYGSLSCNDLKLIDYLYENNYLKLGDDE